MCPGSILEGPALIDTRPQVLLTAAKVGRVLITKLIVDGIKRRTLGYIPVLLFATMPTYAAYPTPLYRRF